MTWAVIDKRLATSGMRPAACSAGVSPGAGEPMSSEHDRTYAQALAALGEQAGAAGDHSGGIHPDDACAWEARLFAAYIAGTLPRMPISPCSGTRSGAPGAMPISGTP
jgi:hypothetical protein